MNFNIKLFLYYKVIIRNINDYRNVKLLKMRNKLEEAESSVCNFVWIHLELHTAAEKSWKKDQSQLNCNNKLYLK